MTNDRQPISLMKKIFSVLLLILGSMAVMGVIAALGSALLRGQTIKDLTSTILAVLMGIGIVWYGAHLWMRWRIALGVILLILSISSMFAYFGYKDINIPGASTLGISMTILSTILLVAGIILIVWQKRRDKKEKFS